VPSFSQFLGGWGIIYQYPNKTASAGNLARGGCTPVWQFLNTSLHTSNGVLCLKEAEFTFHH